MHAHRIKIFLLALIVIISFIMIFPKSMNRHLEAGNNRNKTVLADSGKVVPADSAINEIMELLPQVQNNFFKLKPTINNY
jgi:hypothetical protein